jgi:hypothetical protein
MAKNEQEVLNKFKPAAKVLQAILDMAEVIQESAVTEATLRDTHTALQSVRDELASENDMLGSSAYNLTEMLSEVDAATAKAARITSEAESTAKKLVEEARIEAAVVSSSAQSQAETLIASATDKMSSADVRLKAAGSELKESSKLISLNQDILDNQQKTISANKIRLANQAAALTAL